MHLISIWNKVFQFLLCVVDITSKYMRFTPFKDKKGTTITNFLRNQAANPTKCRGIKVANFATDH